MSVCATKTRVDIKRHLIDGTFPGTHSRAWQKQRWKSVDEKLVNPALADRLDRGILGKRLKNLGDFEIPGSILGVKRQTEGYGENDSRTWVYAF